MKTKKSKKREEGTGKKGETCEGQGKKRTGKKSKNEKGKGKRRRRKRKENFKDAKNGKDEES